MATDVQMSANFAFAVANNNDALRAIVEQKIVSGVWDLADMPCPKPVTVPDLGNVIVVDVLRGLEFTRQRVAVLVRGHQSI